MNLYFIIKYIIQTPGNNDQIKKKKKKKNQELFNEGCLKGSGRWYLIPNLCDGMHKELC